jgi:hypothetical protein
MNKLRHTFWQSGCQDATSNTGAKAAAILREMSRCSGRNNRSSSYLSESSDPQVLPQNELPDLNWSLLHGYYLMDYKDRSGK